MIGRWLGQNRLPRPVPPAATTPGDLAWLPAVWQPRQTLAEGTWSWQTLLASHCRRRRHQTEGRVNWPSGSLSATQLFGSFAITERHRCRSRGYAEQRHRGVFLLFPSAALISLSSAASMTSAPG